MHKDVPCDFKTQTYYAPHSNGKLLEPQSCTRMTVVFRFTSARTEREQVLSYYPFLYHSQTVALLIRHARISPPPSFCPHPYGLTVVFRAMQTLRGPFQTRLSVCFRFGMVCREVVEATKLPRKAVRYPSLPNWMSHVPTTTLTL